ncbi:hypothetical protein BS47DRAFT_1387094 [Hydnum rufescens UP504]|uniref:Uncharacterized protein n=1 Tax=Hydnum rufescens UP504 TaxID=1448309 RepID=A0A9P6E0D5_9AGAM|nr:hypothetical protein BS47DRAFT_1387094 [Hydnum rufescens UP504]
MALVHSDHDGILESIFLNGPGSPIPGAWDWRIQHERYRRVLVRVCKKWRTKAFSMPCLWVHIGLFSEMPIPWLERILDSCGGALPLHIDLDLHGISTRVGSRGVSRLQHFNTMWKTISPYIPRCSHLSLYFTGNETQYLVFSSIRLSLFFRLTHLRIDIGEQEADDFEETREIHFPEDLLPEDISSGALSYGGNDFHHRGDGFMREEEGDDFAICDSFGSDWGGDSSRDDYGHSSDADESIRCPRLAILILEDRSGRRVSCDWLGPTLSMALITHLHIGGTSYSPEAAFAFAANCPRLHHMEYSPAESLPQGHIQKHILPLLKKVALADDETVKHFFKYVACPNLESMVFDYHVSMPGTSMLRRFLKETGVKCAEFHGGVDPGALKGISTLRNLLDSKLHLTLFIDDYLKSGEDLERCENLMYSWE